MPQMQQMNGQNCLIVRGEGGVKSSQLCYVAEVQGVEYLDVYKRIIPGIDSSQISLLLAQDTLDVITVNSGEALQNLLIMLEKKHHHQLFEVPLVVVSIESGK